MRPTGRPQRGTAIGYVGRYADGVAVSYGPSQSQEHLPLRWQEVPEDWLAEDAAVPEQAQKKPRVQTPAAAARSAAIATATASASDPARAKQTAAEQAADLHRWMAQARNANTSATYASGWRQFVLWAATIMNPTRAENDKMDVERPTETEVAAYLRFIVTVKGGTMTSVGAARAAIADHLRLVTSGDYNPTQGKTVSMMISILTNHAMPSRQKKEMGADLMERLMQKMESEAQAEQSRSQAAALAIWRDRTSFLLAFFCLLRTSEVARMVRGDISFATAKRDGVAVRIMRVYINPLCKNDKERRGHERVVQEIEETDDDGQLGLSCVVRSMEHYLAQAAHRSPKDPLFPKQDGTTMSADTPRGRLKHWLRRLGVQSPEEYGFHSLRAGAATGAAQAGVPEQSIKLAGNWKSDNGVRPYIRPQLEDRLRVSDALSGAKRKAEAQAV